MDLDRYAQAVAQMAEEGKYEEALDMAQEALSRLPIGSVETAPWLAHVGEIQDARGEAYLAEQAFQEALTALDLGLRRGPVRLRVLTGLSKVYVKIGRALDAESAAAQAVELVQASPDATATSLAFTLRNLAAVQLLRQDYETAEATLEHIVALLGTALAPDDPELGTALLDLAFLYEKNGRATEANGLREDAAAIFSTPYQRLDERVEDAMRVHGATDAQVAALVARVAEGVPPETLVADEGVSSTVGELAWMLFVRAAELDEGAPVTNAWMIDQVRSGQLSMHELLEVAAKAELRGHGTQA